MLHIAISVTIVLLFLLIGMENLGVTDFNKSPSGSDANQISLDVFLHEA